MKGGVSVGLRRDGCKERCSAGAAGFGWVREHPWGRVMAEQALQKQSGGFGKAYTAGIANGARVKENIIPKPKK